MNTGAEVQANLARARRTQEQTTAPAFDWSEMRAQAHSGAGVEVERVQVAARQIGARAAQGRHIAREVLGLDQNLIAVMPDLHLAALHEAYEAGRRDGIQSWIDDADW
jgi:hypothetical protein